MSATTGIHTPSVYGNQTRSPTVGWREKTRAKTVKRKETPPGPTSWLSLAVQVVLSVLYTVVMLPLMAIGALAALVLSPWLILGPALIAGAVLVLVSYFVTGL